MTDWQVVAAMCFVAFVVVPAVGTWVAVKSDQQRKMEQKGGRMSDCKNCTYNNAGKLKINCTHPRIHTASGMHDCRHYKPTDTETYRGIPVDHIALMYDYLANRDGAIGSEWAEGFMEGAKYAAAKITESVERETARAMEAYIMFGEGGAAYAGKVDA